MTETLTWHPAAELPDSDTTVLIFVPDADETVWPGYWDAEDGRWCYADTMPVNWKVTHWADLPEGPK